MVDKTAIVEILDDLNDKYNKTSTNARDPLYYSKLALMELCGWIEVTMDEMILKCTQKSLSESRNVSYMERAIRRNYGFTYDDHFRDVLIKIVGLVNVERLETTVDPVKFELLKSSLGTLKAERDRAVHTQITDVTTTLSAPSSMVIHLSHVYEGLKDVEGCVVGLTL